MTKDLRNSVIWIVFATLMIGLALWQAQMISASEVAKKHQKLPPPTKTRHALRIANQTVTHTETTRPVSNRELSWLAQDFRTAGLDRGMRTAAPEEFISQRRAAQNWYRDALVEGLALNDVQKSALNLKLDSLLNRAKADFIESLKSQPKPILHEGKWYAVTPANLISPMVTARTWMVDEAYSPQNLAELTTGQLELAGQGQPPFQLVGLKVMEDTSLAYLQKFNSPQIKLLLLWEPDLLGKIEQLLDHEAQAEPF